LQGHEPEIFTHLLETKKELFLLAENTEEEAEEKSEPLPEPQVEQSEIPEAERIGKPVRTTAKLNTRNPEFITYLRVEQGWRTKSPRDEGDGRHM
jgi:hypothetical protein